ncbi:MAG TPA: hypothetical protein VEW46_22750 [Pyrinomonadaceae bacterium]|nr:hypothetical protein [Pyrinomonadaceae bacterium]
MKHPVVVSVSGFTSEVGKTTLMCDLLRAFPGWEAIKMTRGHYRSCGKNPEACCVSHLLSDEPVIHSGRSLTYSPGKDTGRYWEAGAANVHWAIVTDQQVESAVNEAVKRVKGPGVFVEGNSFLDFISVDFAIMVASPSSKKIKASAQRAIAHASALYLNNRDEEKDESDFAVWCESSGVNKLIAGLPIYRNSSLPELIANVQTKESSRHALATLSGDSPLKTLAPDSGNPHRKGPTLVG